MHALFASFVVNSCPAEVFVHFSSFEAGIANAISSVKLRKKSIYEKQTTP